MGGQLLLAAALRCLRISAEVGGAKGDRAAKWYRSFGAEALVDQPLILVVLLALFAEAYGETGHL